MLRVFNDDAGGEETRDTLNLFAFHHTCILHSPKIVATFSRRIFCFQPPLNFTSPVLASFVARGVTPESVEKVLRHVDDTIEPVLR